MIQTRGQKVLVHNLPASEHEAADVRIGRQSGIRNRPERKIFLGRRVDRYRPGSKLTAARRQRRYGHGPRNPLGLTEPFIISKDKCAVLSERAACSGAELVPLERGDGALIKEVLGVQRAIAKEFINVPVKFVRARTGKGVYNAPRALAVLGRIVAGKDREFLDGVNTEVAAEHAARRPVGVIVNANAIQSVIVLLRPLTGDGRLQSETAIAAVPADFKRWLTENGVDSRL